MVERQFRKLNAASSILWPPAPFYEKLKANNFWKRYQRERLKKFGITQKEVNKIGKQSKIVDA